MTTTTNESFHIPHMCGICNEPLTEFYHIVERRDNGETLVIASRKTGKVCIRKKDGNLEFGGENEEEHKGS